MKVRYYFRNFRETKHEIYVIILIVFCLSLILTYEILYGNLVETDR
jgi:hypothetical protein